MDLGVYCNPMALCFTISLSMLKNGLYRSFIAAGGTKLFSNPISFDSLCMSLRLEEELICRVSIPRLPLLCFVIPLFAALNLEFDGVFRPAHNNELLLRPPAKQLPRFTVSTCVFTRVPLPTMSAQADRKKDSRNFFSVLYSFQEISSASMLAHKEMVSSLALSLFSPFSIK